MGKLDIYGAGQLDVLQVGRGHLKLTITEGDAVEVDKARRVIEDMLRRGFAIFVEHDDGTASRVKEFDPERMVYLIDDALGSVPAEEPEPEPKRRRSLREVPVARSRATAVGRTAGG